MISGGRDLAELLKHFKPAGRVFVIVEERVMRLHGSKLPRWDGARLVLPSLGDQLKRTYWLNKLLVWFYSLKVTRSDSVMIVGGGALSDLGGFAASIYNRGVNTVLVPTTLLAQVDAALGGKCGINWRGVKNLVGAFHYPVQVFCGADVLETLPARHYYAGMAEVYKYQLLQVGRFEEFREIKPGGIVQAVEDCCRYKNGVVTGDPFDTGSRRVLNFGHTLAHALEAVDPGLLHGEAVAWGLEYALRVARGREMLSKPELAHVLAVLGKIPRRRLPRVVFTQVFSKMTRDKKNSPGKIGLILPRDQGGYGMVNCSRRELEEHWNTMVSNT